MGHRANLHLPIRSPPASMHQRYGFIDSKIELGEIWSQSKRHSRNDVLDHQAVVLDKDAVNHQPKDLLFRVERWLLESVTDAGSVLHGYYQSK